MKLSAAALVGLLALLASACGCDSPEGADYGPLAVLGDAGNPLLPGGGTGIIHIGKSCVTMTVSSGETPVSDGDTLFLVWPEISVRWDNKNREITFAEAGLAAPDAALVTIRDGDTITVGGVPIGTSLPVPSKYGTWLATPNPDCSGRPWLTFYAEKP